LIAQKYLESINEVAKNAQKVVFMPFEASGVMSSLGSMRELLELGTSKPSPRTNMLDGNMVRGPNGGGRG